MSKSFIYKTKKSSILGKVKDYTPKQYKELEYNENLTS